MNANWFEIFEKSGIRKWNKMENKKMQITIMIGKIRQVSLQIQNKFFKDKSLIVRDRNVAT